MSNSGQLQKIKVFTIGDTTVGKTCFIVQFTEKRFEETHLLTAGIDLKSKVVELKDGKKFQVDFYDTAGQERYRSIAANSIKSADGIILMYDITSQKSYDNISKWMSDIIVIKGNDFPMILIGNKIDLEDKRIISKEEGDELASKYNIKLFETSNKNGVNVEEAALEIINQIVDKKEKEINELIKDFEVIPNFQLDKKKTQKKNTCKCHRNTFKEIFS